MPGLDSSRPIDLTGLIKLMRLIITRPRPDSEALRERLGAMGHDVMVEPMLTIQTLTGAPLEMKRRLLRLALDGAIKSMRLEKEILANQLLTVKDQLWNTGMIIK